MSDRTPLDEALKNLAHELEHVPMSASAEDALRQRLGHRRSSRGAKWLAAALATALVTVVATWGLRSQSVEVIGFLVESSNQPPSHQGALLTTSAGQTVLLDPSRQARMTIEGAAQFEAAPSGVTWRRGTARFSVNKQPQGHWAVNVSHGVIEVVGTEFVVSQHESEGDVELLEGAIRFVGSDGRVTSLRAGQRLHWPLPTVPDAVEKSPAVEPGPTEPTKPTRKPMPSLEETLETVARFRQRGQYEQAADVLVRASRQSGYGSDTRERLSYELGLLYTDQLHDAARACRHWAAHTREWGHGRYGQDIDRARARVPCQ